MHVINPTRRAPAQVLSKVRARARPDGELHDGNGGYSNHDDLRTNPNALVRELARWQYFPHQLPAGHRSSPLLIFLRWRPRTGAFRGKPPYVGRQRKWTNVSARCDDNRRFNARHDLGERFDELVVRLVVLTASARAARYPVEVAGEELTGNELRKSLLELVRSDREARFGGNS